MSPYFIFVKIVCLFILIHTNFAQIPSYKCSKKGFFDIRIFETFKSEGCRLRGLYLESFNKSFEIIPHISISDIIRVEFKDSSLEILTKDVCEALPNIINFNAQYLELISIDVDAFQKCSQLKVVRLDSNFLKQLPTGLFDSNFYLNIVGLSNNQLTEFDKYLFKNTPNLKELYLNNNQFKKVSFSLVMPNLKDLDLSYNKISSCDVQLLIEKIPNVKNLDFNVNNLTCDDQRNLISIMMEKKIKYHDLGNCRDVPTISTTTATTTTTPDYSPIIAVPIFAFIVIIFLLFAFRIQSQAIEPVEELGSQNLSIQFHSIDDERNYSYYPEYAYGYGDKGPPQNENNVIVSQEECQVAEAPVLEIASAEPETEQITPQAETDYDHLDYD